MTEKEFPDVSEPMRRYCKEFRRLAHNGLRITDLSEYPHLVKLACGREVSSITGDELKEAVSKFNRFIRRQFDACAKADDELGRYIPLCFGLAEGSRGAKPLKRMERLAEQEGFNLRTAYRRRHDLIIYLAWQVCAVEPES